MTSLHLGWSRHDITPSHAVPLAGYASRAALGPTDQVLSPLYLRVVALQQDERLTVFVTADLLGWGPDNVARVQQDLAADHDLTPEQIILSGTHTHSGPQPSTWYTKGLGLPDPVWVTRLHDTVRTAVSEALARMVEVEMSLAHTTLPLGVERRFARSAGKEAAAEVRPTLTVVKFATATEVLAAFVHHACHPTLHAGNAISADFPGAMTTSLEDSGDAGVALYLQGCCGNINPPSYDGTTFNHGGLREITAMGERVAEAVRGLLPQTRPIEPALSYHQQSVALPVHPAPEQAELENLAQQGELMTGGWAELLLAHPERRAAHPLQLSQVRLSPELNFLGLGAEVTSPYANFVTDTFGPHTLTLGYCNGLLTYLVTAAQLADGGYESDDAPFWFGMPGRFTPEVEATLHDSLRRLGSR